VGKDNSGEDVWTEKGVWGIRTKGEVRELYKNPDLAGDIKRWKVGIAGACDYNGSNKVGQKETFESKPEEGRRSVGRSILRRLEDTENDIRELKMKMWRENRSTRRKPASEPFCPSQNPT
jgi:hypothetical protein